MLNHTLSKTL